MSISDREENEKGLAPPPAGGWTPGPGAFKMVPDIPEQQAGIDDPTGMFLCHHDPEDVFGCGGSFFEGGFVYVSQDENAANAHLLASAPELYEAAEAFVTAWMCDDRQPGLSDLAIKLRATLAKARGEHA